jgi:hypothetical protein
VALGAPEVEDAASGRAGVVLGSSLNTTTLWVRPEIDVLPHLKVPEGGGFQASRLGRGRGGFLLLTTDFIVHFTGDPG